MNKRLLITGANGMLGSTLVKFYQKEYEVYATGRQKEGFSFVQNYKSYDLNKDSFTPLLEWANPDVIIHCAALTNGNYCEEHHEEAFKVNAYSLSKIIEASKRRIKIIYISTDAVFPSSLHLAKEKSCRNPESVYGKSKELGEFFLYNSKVDFTIVRTTIVGLNFKKEKNGFVEWIINSAKKNEEINLFDDVLFTPLSIWDLAEALALLFDKNSMFSKKAVHIAGGAICTKYEFGIALLQSLDLSTSTIIRGKISEMDGRAKRSNDQSLDCSLFQQKTGRNLPDLKETIEKIKLNYSNYEKH